MNIIYQTSYHTILYDANANIIGNRWDKSTADISAEEFKAEIMEFQKIIETKHPKGIMGNTLDLLFPISPEIQDWIVNNLFAAIVPAGVKKYAIVVPSDFLTQLSVEQTVESETSGGFQTKYFDNETAALDWING